ncbi:MAG: bifunctional phosphoribosyl-AMP cyclohydrolase/phosphoribosyl-ATP diphosphatase HisIE [Treponema sp.]|nr:bifunctional phosphoribosyl-AMP cyclohydrolase/phosphoribosyl-ATP diphosphatase HisIE [Treponema sp.]
MVIASIDLKSGHVVQLKNCAELKLQRDDADELMARFDRYGEVAVIDVDAAMGNCAADGTTANTAVLRRLLRAGNVRVGGGIRSVQRAVELISFGAEKVIIGSAAWKKNPSVHDSPLNTELLDALVKAVGKERIIIAVDARNGNIAVNGWTETIAVPFLDGARAAERYCSELLFTCVEKEGCMAGSDMEAIIQLRNAVSCRVVAAGGVQSLDEIVSLQKINCDVQLGMALYTGAVSLADSFAACLDWEKTPLVPVIAQDTHGTVLMLGYASREALRKTEETGLLTFFSRTRNALWTKGETSGHTLSVVRLRADCDRDTILATVVPHGGVCHTGSYSCFTGAPDAPSTMGRLFDIIAERCAHPSPGSYTATLDDVRVREKIMEEAEEVCSAATREEVVWEAADILYFLNVLLYKEGVSWKAVYDELDRRHKAR